MEFTLDSARKMEAMFERVPFQERYFAVIGFPTVSNLIGFVGLKDWSDAEIAKAIRTGTNRQGEPYKPPMAFPFYAGISDEDMGALIAYLRSLKPQAYVRK